MQQTIILFFCLLSSLLLIITTITRVINPGMSYNQKKFLAWSRALMTLLVCLLWSFFYYGSTTPVAKHQCKDPNHYYCDGGETSEILADSLHIPVINEDLACECDGLGCQ